jgi:hypothetical protein
MYKELVYLRQINNMKQLFSTSIIKFLVLSVFFFSCKTDQKSTNETHKVKDTITTASGLKYFYITKGEGRKVAPGSKVTAMLSLKVNDSVIWTSYAAKDSSFTYIADRGGVIKGYNEMAMLMREGDDVAAFLPSTIAYGDKGSGKVIPPNATLEYNQFKIVHVGEPKLVLSDSLFYALKEHGIHKMKTIYKQATTTKDSALYHGGLGQLNGLWRKLSREQMFKEANDAFSFINKTYNNSTFDFYIIRSLDNIGETKQAISKIDNVLKRTLTVAQKEYFIKYKVELTKKVKKK